jgi:hypothetical protein
MSLDGREFDEPPLFGPQGRIPTIQAVTLTRQSGITALRMGWLPRHTVAMIVLGPLVFGGYTAALGTGFDDPLWTLLLGAMSLVAALILTTYLPLRGAGPAAGSSCAVMAGLLVPGAGILLSQASGIFSGAIALGILSLGLLQRVSGTSACG